MMFFLLPISWQFLKIIFSPGAGSGAYSPTPPMGYRLAQRPWEQLGSVCQASLEMRAPSDPAVPLLGTYPEGEGQVCQDVCAGQLIKKIGLINNDIFLPRRLGRYFKQYYRILSCRVVNNIFYRFIEIDFTYHKVHPHNVFSRWEKGSL